MINTAGDLIVLALKTANINGVGQTPSAEDANDSLSFLSMMVAQWQRKRWLVWSLTETALTSTGAASYTVGSGGNFAIPRPDKIDSAFVRLLTSTTPLDYPLAIVAAREDYNTIALKSLSSWPVALFYESTFPTGVLHVWPVAPAGLYELHIFTKSALPVYTALTNPLGLPPEYLEAALYCLAVRLQIAYGGTPNPLLISAMRIALDGVRLANVQIPSLNMPANLPGRHHGGSGIAASADPGFQSGMW